MVDENSSSFKSSLLDHELRFWELLEYSLENVLRDAEEEGPVLFGGLLRVVFLATNFDHEVWSEVEHELIFAKEWVLR